MQINFQHRALQPSASSSAPTPHAGPYPPGPPPPSGYTDRSDRDRDRTMDTRDRAMIVDRERDRALAAMERDRAMIVDKVTERLSDSFEGIKQEFDHLVTELVTVRKERDDYEKKLSTQVCVACSTGDLKANNLLLLSSMNSRCSETSSLS